MTSETPNSELMLLCSPDNSTLQLKTVTVLFYKCFTIRLWKYINKEITPPTIAWVTSSRFTLIETRKKPCGAGPASWWNRLNPLSRFIVNTSTLKAIFTFFNTFLCQPNGHVDVGDVRNGVRDVVHGLVSHRTKRFFVIFMTNRNFLDFDWNEWQEGCWCTL